MQPGTVIVDLAVEQGGNSKGSERDRDVVKHGVTLVGHSNLPASLLAADASALYARNILNFLSTCSSIEDTSGELKLSNREDEIIAGALRLHRRRRPHRQPLTTIHQPPITNHQPPTTMLGSVDHTVVNLTVFVLAVFVGYQVVWNVTPALHTPLMS